MATHEIRALLSISSDPKTIKGEKRGIRTAICYMAPGKNSGVNLCPMSKLAGCAKSCLYLAGRGIMSTTQNARINRAVLFNTNQVEFMQRLTKEITSFVKSAIKAGFIPAVRLNGTSDIQWENIYIDGTRKDTIFTIFPNVQFYDYTKLVRRFNFELPPNYHLTLSFSGVNVRYSQMCMDVITKYPHVNLAVVADELPDTFMGRPVIDGDESDLRFLDPEGVIVRLKAKGPARKDTTGFVIRLTESEHSVTGSDGFSIGSAWKLR